jgi:hypothetical protein
MPDSRFIRIAILILGAIGIASSRPAFAQTTPSERVAASIYFGTQTGTTTFSQSITFEAFSEEGSLNVGYTTVQHPWIDGGVTVRIWRGFGAGVAASFISGSSPAQINGLIPHPLIPNQPRPISGTADTTHSEQSIHLQAVYWLRASDRIDVVLSGGPSITQIEQDFVSDVAYDQEFPYDVATYKNATLTRERKTVVGGNVGAELGWRVLSRVGVAAVMRYSSATADFPDTGVPPFKIGGLHFGGGVRFLF